MGTKDGNIMATIITSHMRRNDAAAPVQLCPGMRIHTIDASPIPDMDMHAKQVNVVLAVKISKETTMNVASPCNRDDLMAENRDIGGWARS
jgi:hypothetical protein